MASPDAFAKAQAEMRKARRSADRSHRDDALEIFVSAAATTGRTHGLTSRETFELGRTVDPDLSEDEMLPVYQAQIIDEIFARLVAELRAAHAKYCREGMREIEQGVVEMLAGYEGTAHLLED